MLLSSAMLTTVSTPSVWRSPPLGTHFGTGGGGGTDDQTAAEVPYTSDAGGNLPAAITEVQAALDAIDAFELENTFRGAYDS